ncbi:MAG TPA: hypothetical protein VF128_15135, partial [Gemmatimonadaceae bacterium]
SRLSGGAVGAGPLDAGGWSARMVTVAPSMLVGIRTYSKSRQPAIKEGPRPVTERRNLKRALLIAF